VNRAGYVPGVGSRQDLPIAQDRFGRPVENPRQGWAAFLPNIKRPERDALTEAFVDAGVEPPMPPKALSVDGAPVPINAREQRKWQQYMGEFLIKEAPRSMQSGFWAKATKGARQDELRALNEAAAEQAKGRLIDGMGKDFDRRLNESMTRQRGLREAPAGARP
jgi:hypothetical protein